MVYGGKGLTDRWLKSSLRQESEMSPIFRVSQWILKKVIEIHFAKSSIVVGDLQRATNFHHPETTIRIQ